MRKKVFGSAADRQKAYRERKRGNVTVEDQTSEDSVTGVTIEKVNVTLSATDKLFEGDRPGWYIFDAQERSVNSEGKPLTCWKCGKAFTTRLEMNKFCSPQCKNDFLHDACRPKL